MKKCCEVEHKSMEVEDDETICHCFGITKSQIIGETRNYGYCLSLNYVKDMVKKSLCKCEIKNPEGVCCMPKFEKFVKGVMKNEENH